MGCEMDNLHPNTHVCSRCQIRALDLRACLTPHRGHAAISCDGQYMVVSNLTNGVDVYSFPHMERIQQFTHNITNNVPLQVATAQMGTLVVSGGDAGFARVYERSSGKLVASLTHAGSMCFTIFQPPSTFLTHVPLSRQIAHPSNHGASAIRLTAHANPDSDAHGRESVLRHHRLLRS